MQTSDFAARQKSLSGGWVCSVRSRWMSSMIFRAKSFLRTELGGVNVPFSYCSVVILVAIERSHGSQ